MASKGNTKAQSCGTTKALGWLGSSCRCDCVGSVLLPLVREVDEQHPLLAAPLISPLAPYSASLHKPR